MRRRWFYYSLLALAFVAGVWLLGIRQSPAPKTGGFSFRSRSSAQAVPVRAVPAKKEDLPVYLRAIGTVTPYNVVTVRSRVEGMLLRIAFEEGQVVKQGELLAEIDPVPYQIKLAQAEAGQRQNQAQAETARADLARFRQLYAHNLVTQQQLEAQIALAADREGAVAADQSRVDDARRQLAYTRIEAPIPGRLGMRLVDAGNLVRANDSVGLVVITQTRPISVFFTIPENELQKVIDPLRRGEKLTVEAWDRQEQLKLATGWLKTVDNQIDLSTGTLRLKAEFANEDDRLFPNQFVNVRLHVSTLADALVVPAPTVQYGSRGTYVYVVNEESKSVVRQVGLGPTDGTLQSITSGLKLGEMVVLEGHDRLREGRLVEVIPADGVKLATPPPGAPGAAGAASGGSSKGKNPGEKGGSGSKKRS